MKKAARIQKAIWLNRLSETKTIAVAILFILASGTFILIPGIPAGPSKEVTAIVVSISTTQGATGSGLYLICRLNNGEKIHVFLNGQPSIKKEMKVTLLESPRFIGGSKYQFIRLNQ